MINYIKLKKENRKLKKENKTLELKIKTINEKAIIQDKEFCLVPTEMFKQLWEEYSKKPIQCNITEKETIFYNNKYYTLDNSICNVRK